MNAILPDVPKGFFFKWDSLNPANPLQVITKQITGEYPWALRAVSGYTQPVASGPLMYLQIQLPDGRFLENDLEDSGPMVGFGSWRRALSRELLCPVGSKLSVTLLDNGVTNFAVTVGMLLEGAYRRDPRASNGRGAVGDLPRYVPGENQNILAPCAMWGQGPDTPDGYEDRLYTYASDLVTWPLAQIQGITINQQLRPGETFLCRRLLFTYVPQVDIGPPTGTFLIRARASSGYALMDDFIDAEALIGAAPWACDWKLAPSERIYFDLQVVDVRAGAVGIVYLKIYMEGVRRRKKS